MSTTSAQLTSAIVKENESLVLRWEDGTEWEIPGGPEGVRIHLRSTLGPSPDETLRNLLLWYLWNSDPSLQGTAQWTGMRVQLTGVQSAPLLVDKEVTP